jgi:hypothetical protein
MLGMFQTTVQILEEVGSCSKDSIMMATAFKACRVPHDSKYGYCPGTSEPIITIFINLLSFGK